MDCASSEALSDLVVPDTEDPSGTTQQALTRTFNPLVVGSSPTGPTAAGAGNPSEPLRSARVDFGRPGRFGVFGALPLWGQEGLTAETGVAVTLLSHSAHHPSFRATWCFPERGSPMTIVGNADGFLPDTQ